VVHALREGTRDVPELQREGEVGEAKSMTVEKIREIANDVVKSIDADIVSMSQLAEKSLGIEIAMQYLKLAKIYLKGL
jgi:hypothetical protein